VIRRWLLERRIRKLAISLYRSQPVGACSPTLCLHDATLLLTMRIKHHG